MSFEKILCPVDFSECSERALDYSLALARERGAQVSVLHVLPEHLADPGVYPYLVSPVRTSEETRARAYELLGSFVSRALARGVAVDVILESGDVVDEIVERADRLASDVVVVGTHGRRGYKRLLLGSVTERVLRRCRKPVLSIPPSAPPPPVDGAPFKRILCPVDFSPSSLAGLELALALLGESAGLTVLHAVEFYYEAASGEALAFNLTEVREKNRVDALKKLEALVPASEKSRVRLEVAVLHSGGAYREVLRVAEREKSDLIVMGVAGRSATDLLFFGSTTNHVVRSAAAPVLTVRPGD
jgi:nucleotide-binding universal stress UspA family protein